ncbi:hypothetical protein [Bradyrhizobium sp. 195]|uniref:hypothetical protein n=1 Tax=Bradyrhizobium sp. 195 TaxID=2782662 RepID=UPI0020011AC0|nr:hypothetical protein [Bradyrhizobium sp. 195]UPK31266.1 hypothetical protein IVB26_39730 [Bradyrhizobium sp. 195]
MELETAMGSGTGPFPTTELKIVERYKRAAREQMDGPKLLQLLKEIEDEIRRRTAVVFKVLQS